MIFFAISTTLVSTNQGLKLQLPAASSASPQKTEAQVVINHQNEIWFNDQKISLANLKPKVQELLVENPDIQITVQADKNTAYYLVIQILDNIRLGGCFDIVLEAEKIYEDLN